MRYNQLGNTGMFVSELCLGTMTFGAAGQKAQWGLIASLDQKGVNEIVGRSLAAGVNFFDTADVYSFGESEKLLGQSLRNLGVDRQNVVIATKVHGAMGDGPEPARFLARPHHGFGRRQPRTAAARPYRSLPAARHRRGDADRRDAAGAGRSRSPAARSAMSASPTGQAWRIAKALGIAERKGFARFETIQSYYSIAGRDLEREIVPLHQRGKAWPDGLVADGRRPAVRQVRPRRTRQWRGPPRLLQLPAGQRGSRLGGGRRHARDRQEARCQRRHGGARLCPGQALRDERHHRRQPHGAARAEPRRHRS